MQFLTSQRGGTILMYKGKRYNKMNNQTRWYCVKNSQGCRSRVLVTKEGEFIQAVGEHNH